MWKVVISEIYSDGFIIWRFLFLRVRYFIFVSFDFNSFDILLFFLESD